MPTMRCTGANFPLRFKCAGERGIKPSKGIGMPYDEKLAERIRGLFPPKTKFSEKKMFGGLAFFINGNMTITVSGKGGILARVGPENYQGLSDEPGVEVAVM